MDLTDYDALSFDCYGTLIDWEAGLAAVLGPWARQQRLGLSDEELLASYSGNEAQVEDERPELLYPDVLSESFRRTARDLGVDVSDADAAALGASVPDWPAFPDSTEAMTRLRGRYRLIILSNIDRASFAASNRRLGVEFDAVLTAQDIGSYKPNPANFDALLTRVDELGVPRERLLHVAQSLFHDHVPAKAKGLSTIWIDRRRDREGWGATPAPAVGVQPDAEYPSMAAFADAVDTAFAGV
jgi:2-haloalkanoic acid dehalogenase type II